MHAVNVRVIKLSTSINVNIKLSHRLIETKLSHQFTRFMALDVMLACLTREDLHEEEAANNEQSLQHRKRSQ